MAPDSPSPGSGPSAKPGPGQQAPTNGVYASGIREKVAAARIYQELNEVAGIHRVPLPRRRFDPLTGTLYVGSRHPEIVRWLERRFPDCCVSHGPDDRPEITLPQAPAAEEVTAGSYSPELRAFNLRHTGIERNPGCVVHVTIEGAGRMAAGLDGCARFIRTAVAALLFRREGGALAVIFQAALRVSVAHGTFAGISRLFPGGLVDCGDGQVSCRVSVELVDSGSLPPQVVCTLPYPHLGSALAGLASAFSPRPPSVSLRCKGTVEGLLAGRSAAVQLGVAGPPAPRPEDAPGRPLAGGGTRSNPSPAPPQSDVGGGADCPASSTGRAVKLTVAGLPPAVATPSSLISLLRQGDQKELARIVSRSDPVLSSGTLALECDENDAHKLMRDLRGLVIGGSVLKATIESDQAHPATLIIAGLPEAISPHNLAMLAMAHGYPGESRAMSEAGAVVQGSGGSRTITYSFPDHTVSAAVRGVVSAISVDGRRLTVL